MMIAFDLHIHTRRYSGCSFIEYEDLIEQAASAALSGFALTEHGMRWPDEEFDRLRNFAAERGMLLINGQEINTFDASHRSEGEFLVFGLSRSLTRPCSADELVHIVHEEGGIVIAAHPFKLARGGKSHYYGAGDRVYRLKLDAIELCHPDHGEAAMKKVRRAMDALNIPGTGGSDAHKILQVGTCVTVFENPARNEDEFLREIRAGRIRAEKRSLGD
ncbi:MAG TPA: PHP-associated domain-containing protein [Smithellaceae bacterium]|nr:PHP-associated domain-containing protein [Smithellaceae bacterium]HRV44597.1 PHP-associated domain-containing protein [Smithellaceae bacterium]